MKSDKSLALDANILLRGVLGRTVQTLLQTSPHFVFYTTDTCLIEARRNIPEIARQRLVDAKPWFQLLDELRQSLLVVDRESYAEGMVEAQRRIAWRAPQDAPLLALALTLNCPIWSEDQDFFGCGVVTWNSRNISRYFSPKSQAPLT